MTYSRIYTIWKLIIYYGSVGYQNIFHIYGYIVDTSGKNYFQTVLLQRKIVLGNVSEDSEACAISLCIVINSFL